MESLSHEAAIRDRAGLSVRVPAQDKDDIEWLLAELATTREKRDHEHERANTLANDYNRTLIELATIRKEMEAYIEAALRHAKAELAVTREREQALRVLFERLLNEYQKAYDRLP